jgi:hypothetical protein
VGKKRYLERSDEIYVLDMKIRTEILFEMRNTAVSKRFW